MLNCNQFRKNVIQPSLNLVSLYNPGREELLVGTCAQESAGGTFLVQENGPALSIYQQQVPTYQDLWQNFINPYRKQIILTACGFSTIPLAIEMVTNLKYATIMAAMDYLRWEEHLAKEHPGQTLPKANDLEGLWEFYKQYWNSIKGEATRDEFMRNYALFTHTK